MAKPAAGSRFRFALAGGVCLFLVALGVRFLRFEERPSGPERSLTELVRVDGRFVLRGDTNQIFTGWVTERYASGAPRSRSQVVAGRLEGVSEGWHTNGVLQIREHFVAGLSEGAVTRWHPDGTKQSEGTAQAGRFEGVFRRWHPNGVLAEEISMQAGQPHGQSRAWFPNGNLKAEAALEHGRVLKQQHWKDGEAPIVAANADSSP